MEVEEKDGKKAKAEKTAKTEAYKANVKCYAAGRVIKEGEIVEGDFRDNPCFTLVK